MGKNLDNYMARCIELDKPEDETNYKRDLSKVLMRFLVHNSQKQYLNHLRSKMLDLNYEQGSDSGHDQKVRLFKIKLLDRALTLLPTTQIKSESQRKTEKQSPYIVEDSQPEQADFER